MPKAIEAIEETITQEWQGLFKQNGNNSQGGMTIGQVNKELDRVNPLIEHLEYDRDNYTSGLDDKKRQKLKDLKADRDNLNELKRKLMDKKE